MATQDQVNSFIATVMWQVSTIGNILTNLISIEGRQKNALYEFKFVLINIYANIIIDYFSQYPYYPNNFFTTLDQIYQVIDHFNNLCDTNYSITL